MRIRHSPPWRMNRPRWRWRFDYPSPFLTRKTSNRKKTRRSTRGRRHRPLGLRPRRRRSSPRPSFPLCRLKPEPLSFRHARHATAERSEMNSALAWSRPSAGLSSARVHLSRKPSLAPLGRPRVRQLPVEGSFGATPTNLRPPPPKPRAITTSAAAYAAGAQPGREPESAEPDLGGAAAA